MLDGSVRSGLICFPLSSKLASDPGRRHTECVSMFHPGSETHPHVRNSSPIQSLPQVHHNNILLTLIIHIINHNGTLNQNTASRTRRSHLQVWGATQPTTHRHRDSSLQHIDLLKLLADLLDSFFSSVISPSFSLSQEQMLRFTGRQSAAHWQVTECWLTLIDLPSPTPSQNNMQQVLQPAWLTISWLYLEHRFHTARAAAHQPCGAGELVMHS